jgi:hypothetical protein
VFWRKFRRDVRLHVKKCDRRSLGKSGIFRRSMTFQELEIKGMREEYDQKVKEIMDSL